ncbi:MAG: hypothetical protein H6712_09450 [Myxococcales bacterium]|nr:hypothetical protein [Myxococcales bacterium]MCB9714068.1 hypothetical protein [Myxococcales bacterium]
MTRWRSSLVLPCALLSIAACPSGSGDDSGGGTGSPTTTTPAATASATEPSTETGSPLRCDQATTPEQCAQAEPWTADDPYGCSWTPIYVATLAADGSCSFEPMGGSCTEFAYGDTDCGQHPAACGFEVFGEVAEDGTMTIARTPSSCEQDPFVLPLVLCSNGIDAGTGDTGSDTGGPTDEEMLCTCGCAPSYP